MRQAHSSGLQLPLSPPWGGARESWIVLIKAPIQPGLALLL